jgi:hypothetical protein
VKPRFYLSSRYKPKPRQQQNPSQVYEYYKMMWMAAHPEATSQEHETAMKRLSKQAGL